MQGREIVQQIAKRRSFFSYVCEVFPRFTFFIYVAMKVQNAQENPKILTTLSKKMEWENKEIRINWEYLSNLRYAENRMILTNNNSSQLEEITKNSLKKVRGLVYR